METKICIKCGKKKILADFNKGSNQCKECVKNYKKDYYIKNKEQIRKKTQEYRDKNKNTVNASQKKYKETHRELLREKQRKYYNEHKDILNAKHKDYMANYNKKYYNDNKNELLIKKKAYQKENVEKIKEYRKSYDKENKEHIRKRHAKYLRTYTKARKEKDPLFKLSIQIRGLICGSFRRKGYTKKSHVYEILGIDFQNFYEYLLNTFQNLYGYEWDGKEKVHIDHIIPLATATTEKEIIKLCHYTNLQLLKASDNLEKNDKLDWSLENNDKNVDIGG